MDSQLIILMAAAEGGGVYVPTPGPELFPQPAFDATPGLTLTHCSVTGGKLVFDNSGFTATCIGAISAGTIAQGDTVQYSIDVAGAAAAGDAINLNIGQGAKAIGSLGTGASGGDGTYSGTVVLTGVVAAQTIRIGISLNDSGVVTVDNVSVKKIS